MNETDPNPNVNNLSHGKLIQYLDLLKPILKLDVDVIRVADEKYWNLPSPPDLDEFEMTSDEALTFFPSCSRQVRPVVELLSVIKPLLGPRVFLLDVFTAVTVLVHGTLRSKAKYLFKWYNFSRGDLMTELEHTVLILRAADCLHRLKLLGLIEVTRDDARHSALTARARASRNKIHFIPGLTFEDFCSWLQYGLEGRVIFMAFTVLERLADTLISLKNRTNAIYKITNEKREYEANRTFVPRKELFSAVENNFNVHIVHRDTSSISLCLLSNEPQSLSTIPELFVEVHRIKSPPAPLYTLAEKTHSRVFNGRTLPAKCCSRQFSLTTFIRVWPVVYCCNSRVLRADISGLDEQAEYLLTPYSPSEVFRQVHTATLPAYNQPLHLLKDQCCQGQPKYPLQGLCILSACIDQRGWENMCTKYSADLDSNSTVIFTSSVCRVDQILDSFFSKPLDSITNRVCTERIADSLFGQLNAHYAASWRRATDDLFQTVLVESAGLHGPFCSLAKHKQLLAFNGLGPWGHPEFRKKLKAALGIHAFAVIDRLEGLYWQFFRCVQPPKWIWCQDGQCVYFLRDPNQSKSGDDATFEADGSLRSIIDSIKELIVDDVLNSLGQGHNKTVEGIVVVMRDPAHLLRSMGSNWFEDQPAKVVPPVEVAVVSSIPVEKPASIKLRGRYEVIHGELPPTTDPEQSGTSPSDTVKAEEVKDSSSQRPPYDKEFEDFISVLLKWVSGTPAGANQRTAYLVSAGWANGFNFEIKSENASVAHVNLLPTGEVFDPNRPAPKPIRKVFKVRPAMFGGKTGKKIVKPPVVIPQPNSAQRVLRRLTESLPEQAQLIMSSDTSRDRAMVFRQREREDSSDSVVSPIFLEQQVDVPEAAKALYSPSLINVEVCSGPELVNVSSCRAIFQLSAKGVGQVNAVLYEFPIGMSQIDAVSILSCEEKMSLHAIQTVTKRFFSYRSVLLVFEDLKPNSVYGVSIDPSPSPDFPLIAHFKTLASVPGSLASSQVISCSTELDLRNITHSSYKVCKLLDGIRPSAMPVRFIHCEEFVRFRSQIRLELPGAGCLSTCNRRALVTVTGSDDLPDSDLVHVNLNKEFCSFAPRSGSSRCLQALAVAVKFIGRTFPDVKNFTVITQRPIIPFLQKQFNGRWIADGPAFTHKRACVELLLALLHWKAASPLRDCQIVTLIDSKDWWSATISLAAHHSPQHPHHHTAHAHRSRHHHHGHRHGHAQAHGHGHGHGHGHRHRSGLTGSQLKTKNSLRRSTHDNVHGIKSQSRSKSTVHGHGQDSIVVKQLHAAQQHRRHSLRKSNEFLDFSHLQMLVDPPVGLSIRLLMLSQRHSFHETGFQDNIIFPKGPCILGGMLHFVIEKSPRIDSRLFQVIPPKADLRLPQSDPADIQRVAYVLSVTLDNRINEQVLQKRQVQTAQPVVEDIPEEQPPVAVVDGLMSQLSFNSCTASAFLHSFDLCEIVMGPVIGAVTSRSAVILVEFNHSIFSLRCLVRKFGDVRDPGVELMVDVTAFKVCTLKFENLGENCIYELLFPEIRADVILGYFRTAMTSPQYCQVAVTGGNLFRDVPILDSLIPQFASYQTADPALVSYQTSRLDGANVAYADEEAEIGLISQRQLTGRTFNSWIRLSEILRHPSMLTSAVFHLGSMSLLAQSINLLIPNILHHARRLVLPVRDADAVGALYFAQFEEYIKDSFRLMWSNPSLQNALSVGCHIPLFTSDLLLPLSKAIEAEFFAEEVDQKLMQIIRKIFDTHLNSYFSALYEWNSESNHHSRVWRSGSMAVVSLDIVSDRKKLKKKMDENMADMVKAAVRVSSNPFSPGFIEKNQWKFLRNLADDPSICQFFLCTQQPMVSLSAVSEEFVAPEELSKGAMIEFSPTVNDLDVFLQFWVKWMKNGQSVGANGRSFTLLSTGNIPYVTVLQDMSTGLKIQQLCVGNFNGNPENIPEIANVDSEAFVMAGKIGSVRYMHRLGNLENIVVDSSRDAIGNGTIDPNSDLIRQSQPNFAILKVWFDSWKPTGQWSVMKSSGQSVSEKQNLLESTLVLGPILGAPYIIDVGSSRMVMVPVLIELDRSALVRIVSTDVFTGAVMDWSIHMLDYIPKVLSLGPFHLERRYQINFVSGVAAPHTASFVISTFVNWGESNVVIMNCDTSSGCIPCSDYIKDVINQGRVPFSGITTALHLNLQPSVDELNCFKKSVVLRHGLMACRSSGVLSSTFKGFIGNMLSNIRDLYRNLLCRPSLRELFKTTFNLFIGLQDPKSEVNEDIPPEVRDVNAFVDLMISEVHFEYFGLLVKLSHPSAESQNGLRTISTPAQSRPTSAKVPTKRITSGRQSTANLVDELFNRWITSEPLPEQKWIPWITPNGLLTIECIPKLNESLLGLTSSQIEQSMLDSGTRLFIFSEDVAFQKGEEVIPSDNFCTVQSNFSLWVNNRLDRKVCAVFPSKLLGTARFDSKRLAVPTYSIDSVFRSNRTESDRMLQSKSLAVKAQIALYASGKTKQAVKKQEEEFKRLMEMQRVQIEELFSRAKPDGFLILEGKTSELESVQGSDTLTNVKISVMNAIEDDGRPTPFDFIQMPFWMSKFVPGLDGLFIQDEVWLLAHQDDNLRRVIDVIEGEEMTRAIMNLYEQSRLSELSRPEEFREVDMSVPGVVPLFLKELCLRIWERAVPDEIRGDMMDFSDEFVRNFVLSKALADVKQLNAAVFFSDVIKQALALTVAMKLAFKMKDDPKWKFILDEVDRSTTTGNRLAAKDIRLENAHIRGKLRNSMTYDAEELEKDFLEDEAMMEQVRRDRSESDLEVLRKEEVQYEIEETRAIMMADIERREQELEAIENDREEAAAQAAELAASGIGGGGAPAGAAASVDSSGPTAADIRAEAKKTRIKFNSLLTDAFSAAFEKIVSDLVDEATEPSIEYEIREADITFMIENSGNKEDPTAKRIRYAQNLFLRLQQARVEARRKIGERLTFLRVQFA